MKPTAEAVIVGGGVMGCSILYSLAARGMTDTLLLDKDVLCSGSTGKSQGILRMHYSNEVTARMAWESLAVFKRFGDEVGGSSGYVRTGYLLIAGERDRRALLANVEMMKALDVETDVVSRDDVAGLAPAVAVSSDETCAYEPESGYADPYSVTQSYARAAQVLGASVETNTPATSLEVRGGRVTGVSIPGETISTTKAVMAAGPWSRPLLAEIGVDVPLDTVRHQVITLRRPEERIPNHPGVGDLVHSLSFRPEATNLTLVGVGETEQASPDNYEHGVDMAVVEQASGSLAARMPAMSEATFRGGWSGLFTTTPDWHPILGKVDGVDGLYLAVGFSGHGFKLSPMVGAVLAETITESRATSIDVSMLGLGRFREDRLMRSRYGMAVLA